MPREKELFRDNLERLEQKFPEKELLNIKEVSTFCGINYRTAKKRFTFKNNYISKLKFASELS